MPRDRISLQELIADLNDEHADLDRVVSGLDDRSWDIPTPAEGWAVRDQVSHLAFFDDAAAIALTEPEDFVTMARDGLERGGDPMQPHLDRGREMAPAALLDWWRDGRARMISAAESTSPDSRIPWFGPPMGLASFVSARLMETWAHGQDVVDALGVSRLATSRLRHVAHLGVRARPFSYVVRGGEVPEGAVRVRLESPSRETWTWDDDVEIGEARASVTGDALDFCLVVTQRRHLDDTSLVVEGDLALEWLQIAQAFAGPPGTGRSPGRAVSSPQSSDRREGRSR